MPFCENFFWYWYIYQIYIYALWPRADKTFIFVKIGRSISIAAITCMSTQYLQTSYFTELLIDPTRRNLHLLAKIRFTKIITRSKLFLTNLNKIWFMPPLCTLVRLNKNINDDWWQAFQTKTGTQMHSRLRPEPRGKLVSQWFVIQCHTHWPQWHTQRQTRVPVICDPVPYPLASVTYPEANSCPSDLWSSAIPIYLSDTPRGKLRSRWFVTQCFNHWPQLMPQWFVIQCLTHWPQWQTQSQTHHPSGLWSSALPIDLSVCDPVPYPLTSVTNPEPNSSSQWFVIQCLTHWPQCLWSSALPIDLSAL